MEHIIRQLLILALASLAVACTSKISIPYPGSEQVPQTGGLVIYTNSFKMNDMLHKTDVNTGVTYIESGRGEIIAGQRSYTGYYQCYDAAGMPKWHEWLPITRRPSWEYCNKTVFDVTADGSAIDCFSALDTETGFPAAYIQKLTADGEYPWGSDGKLFYAFVPPSQEPDPYEGFVAADHTGGAWVAAGNSVDSIVVARIDKDGNYGRMLKFDAEGSLGVRQYVSRPQMLVADNDELFLLLQYANLYGTMYEGYYDLVRISSEGEILSTVTLMPERMFSRGIYAMIGPDGRGGAYVLFKAAEDYVLHLFLEHFNAQGQTDFEEVDLTPGGAAGNSLEARLAVDPESGNCVTVFMDDTSFNTYLLVQSVDLKGNVLLGKDSSPQLLFKTEDGTSLNHTCGFRLFHYSQDGKVHLFYTVVKEQTNPILKTCTISAEGTMCDARSVVEIGVPQLSDGYEDSVDAILDGHLKFWWMNYRSVNSYGFTVGL